MKLALSILFLCCANAFGQSLINPYRFAAAYTANTAVFDGSNDYMNRAVPTGIADGKLWTFSVWIRFDGGDGAVQIIFDIESGGFTRAAVYKNASNRIEVYGSNASGTEILYITGNTSITAASGWKHVYVCVDMADTSKRKIYVNGVAETLTVTTYSNDSLDLATAGGGTPYSIGANPIGNAKITAALAELWSDDSYLDDTTKFASGGKPISLGSDGSTPTGSQPVFYLKGDGNGFNVNSGAGGDFTLTGSLGTTTPP